MRDWITHDLSWKLFSVFLALVIWLTVYKIREEPAVPSSAVTGVSQIYGSLPVEVVSTSSDVHDYRILPGSVTVKVTGTPEVMAVLQANQIHPVADLTDVDLAPNVKRHVEVSVPPGVTLVSVDPPEVGVLIPPKTGQSK